MIDRQRVNAGLGHVNANPGRARLGRFTEELFVLQRAIRMGDGEHLHAYFTRTRAIRRGIIEAGQDTSAPDFGRIAPPGEGKG